MGPMMSVAASAEPLAAVHPAIAKVGGRPLLEMPRDLYLPPDALEVFLETFEGPLDLLLYLIRRQNLDILDIPIAEITRQYMQYVEAMKGLRLELAAEYLVMAAMLAEIKSRMLLPRPQETADEEEDPRAELARRLQEYERIKRAAEDLDSLPRMGREHFEVLVPAQDLRGSKPPPAVTLLEVLQAFRDVLQHAEMFSHHRVQREPLSVRERMSRILGSVGGGDFVRFTDLFDVQEGRSGVVVTLLAVLELVRESLLELIQTEAFGQLYVRAAGVEP
jgi:segregation and condensation protein A